MDGAADGFFAEALAVYYHRLRPADFYRRAFKLGSANLTTGGCARLPLIRWYMIFSAIRGIVF